MSTTVMEELPSPIKPREDDLTQPPPSPLETEADDDEEGGPSSVEAQADPSDLSFDLDLDLPTPSYPLSSPQPSTSNDILNETNGAGDSESQIFGDLFTATPALEPDIKVEGAVAGICGFYNFANTCYMNSGLQCLLATPTIVKYFTDSFELSKDIAEKTTASLIGNFQPLLRDVWAGDYTLLKPVNFKESLANVHPQFSGAHQHDCQEFLALLLDSMHEELRQDQCLGKGKSLQYESECGTSMELHTAHSTEKEAVLSMSWLSRNSSLDDHTANSKRVNQNIDLQDGNESRGSASPKSYDSRSSVEDKVAHAIRQLPIPKTLKVKNSKGSSCSGDDEESMEDDMSYFHEDDDTMDSSNSSNQPQPTSNLIAPDLLKRSSGGNNANVRFTEEVDDLGVINNANDNAKSASDDFYQKENKTLNVNVLAEETGEMNNEITFDSEKFAKCDAKLRPRGTIENNLGTSLAGNNGSSKRLKNEENADHVVNDESIKRIRLDSSDKEKNIQLEMERTTSGGASAPTVPTSPTLDPARLKEAIEADRFWEKYLALNDTVLARTFQGQFKSSVVCKTCHYVSVSFEPFMYLPVPLPNANIRQMPVTYINGQSPPMILRLDMGQSDNVGHLKAKLMEELNLKADETKLQIAEVFDHHVTRVVDDWTLLKCLKADRQLYAVKVTDYQPAQSIQAEDSESKMDDSGIDDSVVPESTGSVDFQSCVICMEDLPSNELKQHNACDCVMCIPCLDRTIEHHMNDETVPKDHIKCPGCRQEAEPESEFVTLDQIGKSKPKLRMLNLPVVSRWSNEGSKYTTFGHPAIVQVPNQITSKELFRVLRPFIPKLSTTDPNLALVNAQGKLCSRCIFNSHCFGCIQVLPDEEKEILLQINDTIALTFEWEIEQTEIDLANSCVHHESMDRPKIKDCLNLDDCLEAFSRTEELDETNPWYCPMCRKNKCATKTLSVWRFPDYLIIYLKRFVFTNSGALKLEKDVEFKVDGLDLTPYLSGPLQSDSKPIFDLYGCVCHFGCVYGGHYTAFAKHLGTNQWNHFNDNSIQESKIPGESFDDKSSAYILFYQRSGSKHDNLIPSLSHKCRAFALDNNEKEELNNHRTSQEAMVDDDDDEAVKPDLSQIIRSLDTPPPP